IVDLRELNRPAKEQHWIREPVGRSIKVQTTQLDEQSPNTNKCGQPNHSINSWSISLKEKKARYEYNTADKYRCLPAL
ncbi:hypothetical protein ABTL56_19595, partial [Acinetobacter baumannii]